MFPGQHDYHAIIRKTIVAFGALFSSIQITRESKDGLNDQTIAVPLAYAPKEKWLVRLEQDPDLTNNTYTTLPRLSFEITGYSYDSTRKLNKMNKVVCNTPDGSSSMFSPVPYNIDITLYVLTKTQEDALQIIEQILPVFGPEYTLAIKAVPEMNIIQDIPVILNSISVSDEYDGDFQTRRFVTHTLTFTLKVNLYGSVTNSKPIYHVDANISEKPTYEVSRTYSVEVDPETQATLVDEWIDNF